MKPKHSKPDSRGMLWVACSECRRGGNGDQSCSSGWRVKKGGKLGCFSGELLEKYNKKIVAQESDQQEKTQPNHNTESGDSKCQKQ